MLFGNRLPFNISRNFPSHLPVVSSATHQPINMRCRQMAAPPRPCPGKEDKQQRNHQEKNNKTKQDKTRHTTLRKRHNFRHRRAEREGATDGQSEIYHARNSNEPRLQLQYIYDDKQKTTIMISNQKNQCYTPIFKPSVSSTA